MDDFLLFDMCFRPDSAHLKRSPLSVRKSLIMESFAICCINVFVNISDRVWIVDRTLMQHMLR